ncbi:MAG: hypothetical protein V3R41_05360, partial [Gammaproteobacteria bacterium]
KEEYCQMLIEHMSKGLSFESFAAITDTCRDTIYEWVKVHKEFSDAKRGAFAKSQLFWEEIGIEGLFNGKNKKSLNSAVWIFNMKNRFNWTDKQELDLGEETQKMFQLAYKLDKDKPPGVKDTELDAT